MNILITNDDGIYSEGIFALKRELEKIAKVFVIAPEREKSATSHCLTLHKVLRLTEVKIHNKFFGYATNGSPSDCVVLGILDVLKKKPDLIVSGINRGGNLGGDLTYSGTVSGAMEGAIFGIKSFAISIAGRKNPDFNFAAKFTKNLAKVLIKKELPPWTFLNVNIPNISQSEIKGIELTYQAKQAYKGKLEKRVDLRKNPYYWIGGYMPQNNNEIGSDLYCIRNKKISITPVHLDLTNYQLLKEMEKWEIKKLFPLT